MLHRSKHSSMYVYANYCLPVTPHSRPYVRTHARTQKCRPVNRIHWLLIIGFYFSWNCLNAILFFSISWAVLIVWVSECVRGRMLCVSCVYDLLSTWYYLGWCFSLSLSFLFKFSFHIALAYIQIENVDSSILFRLISVGRIRFSVSWCFGYAFVVGINKCRCAYGVEK